MGLGVQLQAALVLHLLLDVVLDRHIVALRVDEVVCEVPPQLLERPKRRRLDKHISQCDFVNTCEFATKFRL
jgi:hypothetical protein